MPPIPQILAALRTTRSTFSTLFGQVQVGLPRDDRRAFEAIALVADDTEAFRMALQYAQDNHLLQSLVERLINERQEDGSLTQAVAEATDQARVGGASLQAMVNEAQGFEQPDTVIQGITDGRRWTGQITVMLPGGGQSNGTCILIGPYQVLTAWHVVHSLFRRVNPDTWEPDPTVNGSTRIQVEFYDYLVHFGEIPTMGSIRITAHPTDWCEGFSPCHQDELENRFLDDPEKLTDHWDYVIIRLNAAPGADRSWAMLDTRGVVPAPTENCRLFQYPAAQTLRLAQGPICQFTPPNPDVARLRFLHQINALGGSSGGPCFDRSFMLIGLHQGVWSNVAGAPVINRGIPIVPIIKHIEAENKRRQPPEPDTSEILVWELVTDTKHEPVIGLNEFRSISWRLAMAGGPKVLIITGTKGSGKTFCTRVLSQMLPSGGHVKITLNAGPGGIGSKDARQLVADICSSAGIQVPILPDVTEGNSTPVVWLKSVVMPALMTALETVSRSQLVWILLTDLNSGAIDGLHASEFLFLLYEQTLRVDWLRIVLDGVRADIPESLNEVTVRFRTKELTQDDIEAYLRHFFATLDGEVDDLSVRVQRNGLMRVYEESLNREPDDTPGAVNVRNRITALKDLAAAATFISNEFRQEANA